MKTLRDILTLMACTKATLFVLLCLLATNATAQDTALSSTPAQVEALPQDTALSSTPAQVEALPQDTALLSSPSEIEGVARSAGGVLGAKQMTDTLEIRFGLDSVMINMGFDGNQQRWTIFERNFMQRFGGMNPLGVTIDIYSGASPEGTVEHNRWLGQERGESIRQLIEQRLSGRVGYIVIHNEAARWQGLFEAVEASNETWRDEVLSIIRQPASINENGRDRREWKLRRMQDGKVWERLVADYLPPLRSGASAIVSWRPENVTAGRDTIVVIDTVYVVQPVVTRLDADDTELIEAVAEAKPVERYPVWLVRSNLLFLATGTPNVQLEWSLGHKDRWSLNMEGMWSWWTFARNAYANEIIYGSVELRHWLGRRYRHHTLEGWHIGLGIGGGYGDVEWKSRGYQAEVYSGFVNIGWQGRFGKRKQWAIDMGIGLGYAYVPWRRYRGSRIEPEGHEEQYDDHLMWQETNRTHWIGTPHINISIGYVFPQRDAQWKRNKAILRDVERNERLHYRDSIRARERFVNDSLHTVGRQRRMEIVMMPKSDERKAAFDAYYAEKKQAKAEKKEQRKLEKANGKQAKRQAKEAGKQLRQQLKEERAQYQAEQERQRELSRSPEGRAAMEQRKAEAKAAKRQQKADAKAAKKQAKLDRRASRIRARIEARQRRNQQRLQRELRQTEEKYKVIDN